MHLDKENKRKETKPAVAAPEQRSGWRAVGEAVKASLPATMEGSASQTSGTPCGEEWNAARAREKNTRVERRGGKLRFGRSEPIRSGDKLPAVRGWGGGLAAGGSAARKQTSKDPSRLPDFFLPL